MVRGRGININVRFLSTSSPDNHAWHFFSDINVFDEFIFSLLKKEYFPIFLLFNLLLTKNNIRN